MHSFGFKEPHYINGNGLPYNFPFVPNVVTPTSNIAPTFPPAPPIDPRINRINSMLNVMLNAKDLQIQVERNPFSGDKK